MRVLSEEFPDVDVSAYFQAPSNNPNANKVRVNVAPVLYMCVQNVAISTFCFILYVTCIRVPTDWKGARLPFSIDYYMTYHRLSIYITVLTGAPAAEVLV